MRTSYFTNCNVWYFNFHMYRQFASFDTFRKSITIMWQCKLKFVMLLSFDYRMSQVKLENGE